MISALLLLGPTGAGKTPLGQLLESTGLAGRKCHHFDFGDNLRALYDSDEPPGLFTSEDLAVISRVIDEGSLLEDHEFPVALKIFRCFVEAHNVVDDDLVLLNGMPRHVGQAQGMTGHVDMHSVVLLACPPEVVLERIRLDTGGDRGGRTDDRLNAIRERIGIFEKRTRPLVDFYVQMGTTVRTIEVGTQTTAEEMRSQVEL